MRTVALRRLLLRAVWAFSPAWQRSAAITGATGPSSTGRTDNQRVTCLNVEQDERQVMSL